MFFILNSELYLNMVFYCWSTFEIQFGNILVNNIFINQTCLVKSFLFLTVLSCFNVSIVSALQLASQN